MPDNSTGTKRTLQIRVGCVYYIYDKEYEDDYEENIRQTTEVRTDLKNTMAKK